MCHTSQRAPWGGNDGHSHFVAKKTAGWSQKSCLWSPWQETVGLTSYGLQFIFFTIFSCSRQGKIRGTPEMHPPFPHLTLDTLGTGVSVSFDKEGFWGPARKVKDRGEPQGGSKSEIQLYACSPRCLCVPLDQGPVASGCHRQPWRPLPFLPGAILPLASSQGHTSSMSPNLPDSRPCSSTQPVSAHGNGQGPQSSCDVLLVLCRNGNYFLL